MLTPLRGLALCLLLAAPLLAQDEPERRQVYLNGIRAAQHLGADAVFDGRLPLSSAYRPMHRFGEGRDLISRDHLIDAIREFGDHEAYDEAQAQVQGLGDSLISVYGSDSVIKSARDTLAFYERAFASPMVVEVWSLVGGAPGVLDAAGVERVLRGADATLMSRRSVFPGQDARMGQTTRDRFVADYEVEIAQEAVASRPIIRSLATGLRVDLRLDWTIDGRVFIDYFVMNSFLQGMQEAGSAAPDAEKVQLPSVRAAQVGGNAVVPAGGGLVVQVVRGEESSTHLLRVIGQMPNMRFGQKARAIPSGALTLPVRRFRAVTLSHQNVRELETPDDDEGDGPISADWLIEIGLMADRESFEESPDARMNYQGGRCVVAASVSTMDKVQQSLERMEKEVLKTRSVEVRMVSLARDSDDAVARARISTEVLVSGGATVMDGRVFRILAGREVAQIRDFGCEVAQKAKCYDPQIGLSFDGFVLDGRFEKRVSGGTSFRGALALSAKRGPDRERQVINSTTEGGAIRLPKTQDLVLEISAVLPDSEEWQLVATTQTAEGAAGLLMRVRSN
jgi:hypothetical protein